ncbi:MAG: cytochrome-c oxidase, cbb3-type subunit II [Thiotrichales bacterium]
MSHEVVEKNIGLMGVLVFIVVSMAALVEIIPLYFVKQTTEPVAGLKPYTALQFEGRDIYIRESCNACHSQQIRPFRAETERYGHYSVAGEFVYDHPFLWGSKRTGPDLARVGGRYSDDWHRLHLTNPRSVVPESNMPAYPWLSERTLDTSKIAKKLTVMNTLGHTVGQPDRYSQEEIDAAPAQIEGKTEMDALIAYLQVLGTHVSSAR